MDGKRRVVGVHAKESRCEYFHLQREIALEVAPSGEARVGARQRPPRIYHELAILIADYALIYGLKYMRNSAAGRPRIGLRLAQV